MKVLTVVGARPQFIKAAVVSHILRKRHQEILLHTGQHYDYNMSRQFFEELDIPEADYNLGISGGSHGQMTGKMLIAIEETLLRERPDWLLLYGDTNSTLAGALAAAKLRVPVCHVEAGDRLHTLSNPEEINRVCTDHVSALLLACTESGMSELRAEGLSGRARLVGDPMYDAFAEYSRKVPLSSVTLSLLDGGTASAPERYYYLTCHREENTREDATLLEIFRAMEQLDCPVVYPVHPRNKSRALRLRNQSGFRNLILTEPVGYLESMALVRNAQAVVTDSGGLQREAFFAEKKCVTVFPFVVWPETMTGGRNTLSAPDAGEILSKLREAQSVNPDFRPFGDGHAAERIVKAMEESRPEWRKAP